MTSKTLKAEWRIGEEHHEPETALEIVENFEIIVERERLLRGQYIAPPGSATVWEDEDGTAVALKECGAMCGGARACAMGTLHMATGKGWQSWPGSAVFNAITRDDTTPLGVAMAALDEAAFEYAEENELRELFDPEGYSHRLEELFENTSGAQLMTLPETPDKIDFDLEAESAAMRPVMLEVARRAKEKLA
jgi:hypothetical protein